MASTTEVRVEEQIAALENRRQLFEMLHDERVELRSDPAYPLLIDPAQKEAAEYFGIIRTRLLNARSKSELHTVVITSAQKHEGKSLTCLNLSISLAQLQKERILLIDGDLRVRGVTRLLQLQSNTGLSDFLTKRAPFEHCIKATNLSHLYVAPAGQLEEDSLPAILAGASWPEFLRQAKELFGLIIVDSVPVCAPIADFELLLSACNAALLVAHMRKTKREALDSAAQQLGGKLIGVIVNNTDSHAGSNYQYYYGKK